VQTILYVMAIMGCGENDSACRELRVEQAAYRSEAQCMAATADVLARHDDIAYPNIVAQCRPSEARPTLLRGSDVLRPEAGQPRREAPLQIAASGVFRSSR